MAFFRVQTATRFILALGALAVIGLCLNAPAAAATTPDRKPAVHKTTAKKTHTAHKKTTHKTHKKTAHKARHRPVATYTAANPRYAALVMDADTGVIFSQVNPDKQLYPASLTKLMTLLIAFEAIEDGSLRLRDRIPISQHAASMAPSRLDLPAGSTIATEDAIYAIVTKSANDIATALAERIGGNEARFVNLMNNRARSLGMSHTSFANASGLPNSAQVTSARDMALLARYIVKRYPRYYRYFSTREFSYLGVTYRNHNHLMERYPGMDGFKTGFINASGFNLVASAVHGHHRLIGVVFGGNSAASRDSHMEKLLNEAFAKYDAAPAVAHNGQQRPPVLASIAPLPASSGFAREAQEDAQWAELRPMLQNRAFSDMVGQGDVDPAAAARIETGMLAVTAQRHLAGNANPAANAVRAAPPIHGGWSIQIGAFSTLEQTNRAVQQALNTLPRAYAYGAPRIVPLKTNNGTIYRGRISGYSRDEAIQACRYIRSCLPVSPQAY
jgi:D-alanyl-D-alanine carboxypeptidase